jgi:hypothetical protein
LLKLGMDMGETSVSKYLMRRHQPPSQTWRTYLDNHMKSMVSVDFLRCRRSGSSSCICSWCWAHERRRIPDLGVTAGPTAEWTAQPPREAFPWETAPGDLSRDRDRIFGGGLREAR